MLKQITNNDNSSFKNTHIVCREANSIPATFDTNVHDQ